MPPKAKAGAALKSEWVKIKEPATERPPTIVSVYGLGLAYAEGARKGPAFAQAFASFITRANVPEAVIGALIASHCQCDAVRIHELCATCPMSIGRADPGEPKHATAFLHLGPTFIDRGEFGRSADEPSVDEKVLRKLAEKPKQKSLPAPKEEHRRGKVRK